MKKYIGLFVVLTVFLTTAVAVLAYDFPSTNELNKNQQTPGYVGKLTPYVEVDDVGFGYVDLRFVAGYAGYSAFEYRIDGEVKSSGTPHPVVIGDFIYPNIGVYPNTSKVQRLEADQYVEVRLALGGERDWDFDWTRFDVLSKDDCKDGGWEALGYANQGLCIQDFNT